RKRPVSSSPRDVFAYATAAPSADTASVAICRSAPVPTGAPTSATLPRAAQAAAAGARSGPAGATGGASRSGPGTDRAGNPTTRAAARSTASAWASALARRSPGTQRGWATAIVSVTAAIIPGRTRPVSAAGHIGTVAAAVGTFAPARPPRRRRHWTVERPPRT